MTIEGYRRIDQDHYEFYLCEEYRRDDLKQRFFFGCETLEDQYERWCRVAGDSIEACCQKAKDEDEWCILLFGLKNVVTNEWSQFVEDRLIELTPEQKSHLQNITISCIDELLNNNPY